MGALRLTITALSLGTIHADGPNQPSVSEQVVIDPEDDPFGIITGYEDARLSDSSPGSVISTLSTGTSYVGEFEEWGMVLDGTSRTISPGVSLTPAYVNEFEEWGMAR